MSKGVLGLGCSYTWGEGLYYYSDLESLPFSENHEFDYNKVTPAMMLYKDRYKYTNLVADYLNTWCWTNLGNGGTIQSITEEYMGNDFSNRDKFNMEDFKLMIFQFTEYYRDFNGSDGDKKSLILSQINMVDSLCSKFEKIGVKVISFSWFDDISTHPLYIEKFKDRHMDIELDNIVKPSFDFFLRDDMFNITIQSDFAKKGFQKNDLHFNKKGHKLISNLIIKKLEQDNFKI